MDRAANLYPFISTLLYLFYHNTYVYVGHIHMYTCVCVCMEARGWCQMSSSIALHLIFRNRVSTEHGDHWLDRVASQWVHGMESPLSASSCRYYRYVARSLNFLLAYWDPNSSSHDYIANILNFSSLIILYDALKNLSSSPLSMTLCLWLLRDAWAPEMLLITWSPKVLLESLTIQFRVSAYHIRHNLT